MRRRLYSVLGSLIALAACPVLAQAPRTDDTALATLCMVEWSIGPIWAGWPLGCPAVVQPLEARNQPCRRRYSTSEDTREEARLRYDTGGRLREVEDVGRGRTSYDYDVEGRLTTRTTRRTGYPATTTSFTYTRGSITDDSVTSEDRYRWQVEGARVVSQEYVHGGPDAAPMSIARGIYESDVLVGLDTVLCRTPSSDGSPCEPAGAPSRSRITRDRTGRIRGWTNGEGTTVVYTYDSRNRLIRVRSVSPRLRDDMRIDYVCPEG